MAYVEIERLKESMGIEDTDADDLLRRSLDAATSWIDSYTGRVFTLDATAVEREFYPESDGTLTVPDVQTITSVEIDRLGNLTYDTTLATTDYELLPLTGPPYQQIKIWPTSSHAFTSGYRVRVTGTFGYASVPKAVEQACLILASRYYKRGEAPFGVLQATDLGQYTRISKEDPDVVSLLAPYRITGASWVIV